MSAKSLPLQAPTRAVSAGLVLFLSALAVPFQEAAAQWPMFRVDPAHSSTIQTRGAPELAGLRWTLQTEGPVRSSPVVEEGVVYVGSGDGHLYAIDFERGVVRWAYDAGAPISSTAAVGDGKVYVQDDRGTLHSVGIRDGAPRWQMKTGALLPFPWGLEGWDYLTSSPVLVDDMLVFGAGDGHVYAVSAEDGSVRWSHPTGGRIRATPAAHEGTVYVGSADGFLYALSLEDGELLWRFETRGVELDSEASGFDRRTIQSSVTVTDDAIYFGSRDANLYRLDHDGREVWAEAVGTSWVVSTPAVSRGTVYAGLSAGRRFDAREANTGELRFSVEMDGLVFASPIVVDDLVYLTGEDGRLLALDAASGETRWSYQMDGASYGSPAVVDGVVLVGDDAGRVYAVEGGERPTPRAVFWDEELREAATLGYRDEHRVTVDHFADAGYDVLDGPGLEAFLRSGMRDGSPGVVVFAMDALPEAVAPGPEPGSLLHQFLDAGGKAVWLGMPPFFLTPVEDGSMRVDREGPGRFLGVSHDGFNTDTRTHRPTPEGKRWGLSGWWTGWAGVDPSQVSLVLATDDDGLATAWVKEFGGEEGSGFVRLQASTEKEALEQIQVVAEHGIFRRL